MDTAFYILSWSRVVATTPWCWNDVLFFHSPRAAEFQAKGGKQLAEWFATVGLDMYTDLVEKNLSSGEQLVTMVTANNNTLLAVS